MQIQEGQSMLHYQFPKLSNLPVILTSLVNSAMGEDQNVGDVQSLVWNVFIHRIPEINA